MWQMAAATITGFIAKESVVATTEVLFGGSVTAAMTSLSAACMLVFSLLYTPCAAAIAAVRREMGAKWAAGMVLWQCAIAWVMAFLVRLIGMILS